MENDQNKQIENGKVCAILAYLLVGIIWFFADEKMKKNSFVKFHAQQALVLLIISVFGSLFLTIAFILVWLLPLFQLAVFILVIIGIVNAAKGEEKELPIVGQFGKKLKI